MKSLLIIALLALSCPSFSQPGPGQGCVKCHSFEEAAKEPEKVLTIMINSYLHGITLKEVPDSIKIFVNLEKLYLTDHGLTSVPKVIGSLSKLKVLSFGGNELEKLPEEIFELKNLEELILFNNKFSEEYKRELRKKCKEKLPNTKLMIDLK
jgi:hypothetical protein